jgi:hypothetical protein
MNKSSPGTDAARATASDSRSMNAFDVLAVIFAIVGIPLLVALAVVPAAWDVLDARTKRAKQAEKVNSQRPAVTGPALTRW